MIYDFLIIGHGLAGAILAETLRSKGLKILVIDEPKINSASRVAAGLINPLAGKRYAKSWHVEQFLPFASNFYKTLEKRLGEALFIEKPILKLFSTIEDQNNWMAKSAGKDFSPFEVETELHLPENDFVNQKLGGIRIKGGGYLRIKPMLDKLEETLQAEKLFIPERFDFNKLVVEEEKVQYGEWQARQLIFCEGYQAVHNPYFKWLPFSPNKGEVLDVQTDNFTPACIYNKAVYVVPVGENLLRTGATYNWREVNEEITAEGKAELSEKLGQIINVPFNVSQHYAGIRPAVRDRKPLIGTHPHHPNLHIFNGMGSKGVLMAPYLANHFAEVLQYQKSLMPEINISRYFSLY